MSRRFQVSRGVDDSVAVNLREHNFDDAIDAIAELGKNSHDGDADNLTITYDGERLVLEDDGDGMRAGSGLEEFFRPGGSVSRGLKSRQKRTKKGRIPVGKFGWGALGTGYLALEMQFDTWRDGVHSSAHEVIDVDQTIMPPVTVHEAEAPPGKHGTKIELTQLRFSEDDRDFSIDRLMYVLGERMPEIDGFSITVNGSVVTPFELKGAVEYVIDVDDPLIGKVTGSIFYARRSLGEKSGIWTKVIGVPVGDKDRYKTQMKVNLQKHVHGRVYADGLDPFVHWGRKGLKSGPESRRLDSIIENVLRQVRQDMETAVKDRKIETAQEGFGKIREERGRLLGEALGSDNYTFVFDAEKAGTLLTVDTTSQVVYVNPGAAPFRLPGLQAKQVRSTMSKVVEYAGARISMDDQDWSRFESLAISLAESGFKSNKKKVYTLADLVSDKEEVTFEAGHDPGLRLSPARLYESSEVETRVGWRYSLLNRFNQSGVLKERKGKYLGEDLQGLRERLKGKVPLYHLVRMMHTEETDRIARGNRFTGRENFALKSLRKAKTLPTWVENWGTGYGRDDSMWVIDRKHFDDFAYFVEHGEFPEHSEDTVSTSTALALVEGRDYDSPPESTMKWNDEAVTREEIRMPQFEHFSFSDLYGYEPDEDFEEPIIFSDCTDLALIVGRDYDALPESTMVWNEGAVTRDQIELPPFEHFSFEQLYGEDAGAWFIPPGQVPTIRLPEGEFDEPDIFDGCYGTISLGGEKEGIVYAMKVDDETRVGPVEKAFVEFFPDIASAKPSRGQTLHIARSPNGDTYLVGVAAAQTSAGINHLASKLDDEGLDKVDFNGDRVESEFVLEALGFKGKRMRPVETTSPEKAQKLTAILNALTGDDITIGYVANQGQLGQYSAASEAPVMMYARFNDCLVYIRGIGDSLDQTQVTNAWNAMFPSANQRLFGRRSDFGNATIRSLPCQVSYGDGHYILGIFAKTPKGKHDVTPYFDAAEGMLQEQGFQKADLERDSVKSLYESTQATRRDTFPVTKKTFFEQEFPGVLETMVAAGSL